MLPVRLFHFVTLIFIDTPNGNDSHVMTAVVDPLHRPVLLSDCPELASAMHDGTKCLLGTVG